MSPTLSFKGMNAGQLRYKVTILYNAKPNEKTANGFPDPEWQELASVRAKKSGLRGYLYFKAAAVQAEGDVMFTIRYREDVKAGMRIKDGHHLYEIKTPPIDVDGKRRWLDLHTREVLQNGG